jgi:ferredoxin-NADP reductase
VLVHGAFKKEELFFREELERRAQSCAGFTYIPTLVEPQGDWGGERGTIEVLWARGAVAARSGLTPRPEDTHVSLCGTLSLVDTMIGVLQGQGYRPALDGHGTFDWCEAD